MKVYETGEFELIRIIEQMSSGTSIPDDLVLGIGDDAAAWRDTDTIYLCTTDMLVEGTHFNFDTISWSDLGRKALVVNLSDIAAMGGKPVYALLSLGVPANTEVESITEMFKSIAELAADFDVSIIGGDTTESPVTILNFSILGRTIGTQVMTRSGAVKGDQVAVTGNLGASAAGLKLLTENTHMDSPSVKQLKQSHLRPEPRIKEGLLLAEYGVKAAIDISDGLAADLTHVCQASQVGATIYTYDIPIGTAVKEAYPTEGMALAVSGGEDYELLFTAPAQIMQTILSEKTIPVTVIGEITDSVPGKVVFLDSNDNQVNLSKLGWEHFVD